jgi:hypothetical protein
MLAFQVPEGAIRAKNLKKIKVQKRVLRLELILIAMG